MKTNKLVTHIVGKSNLYDKDKFKDGIYFAKDSQEIFLNGLSYGGSDIKWEDITYVPVAPINTIYLKNVKDIELLDGILDVPDGLMMLVGGKEKLKNQDPFEGIVEIVYDDKSEKMLISGNGLKYSLDRASDVKLKIRPISNPRNSSLRIPKEFNDSIDKIELMEMDGEIVSFIRPDYAYHLDYNSNPEYYKINYVLEKKNIPAAEGSFLCENVDSSFLSNFSKFKKYSFIDAKIDGDLTITENQIVNSNSIFPANVLGDVSITSNNKYIHPFSFSGVRSKIVKLDLNNTEVIGRYAFSACNITDPDFKLPDTLKYINDDAFNGAKFHSNISTLNIPKFVVELGKGSFSRSTIQEVNVYETVKDVAFAFDRGVKINRIQLQHIKIKADLDDIDDSYSAKVVQNYMPVRLSGATDKPGYIDIVDTLILPKDGYVRYIADENHYKIVSDNNIVKQGASLKISPSKNQDPIKGSLHISLDATSYGDKTIVYSPFREIVGTNPNSEITYTYSVEKADIAGIDSLSIVGLDNYPEGVKEIAPFAFTAGFKQVTDLNLPDTLKIIHEDAYGGMYSGGDIIIPDGMELIKKNAFRGLRTMNPTKKVKVLVNKNTVVEPGAFSQNNYEIIYK